MLIDIVQWMLIEKRDELFKTPGLSHAISTLLAHKTDLCFYK